MLNLNNFSLKKKYNLLRRKYPRFIYENYSWKISGKDLKISFNFKIKPDIKFQPKVAIKNIDKNQIRRVGDRVLNNLVFHLGLIEILSYWKATCSPEIFIKAGPLNEKQIKWWKDLIIKGMGQFFFENKIDFRKPSFIKIKTKTKVVLNEKYERKLENRVLVPIGGGKDSIVTLEILKKAKKNITCFSLNPTSPAQEIIKTADCENSIIIERKIDPKLLELNQKGFLNGHTPFSAYLAFLSVLCAILFNFKYIVFSNERSSNEGNVKYLGRIINHQYSKSFDFEKRFRDYSKKYLAKNVEYFSFLRPLYEIQIAKLFSNYPKYFSAFLSCNVAYQTDSGLRPARHPPAFGGPLKKPIKKWCGNCPKCLFVFASLYPFVDSKKIVKIFGQNLFEDRKLLPIMQELIGERKFKPFECVGTKKESLVAFHLSYKKYIGDTYAKLPFILRYFEKKILLKYLRLEKEAKKLLNSWNKNHFLPKKFEEILKIAIRS